MSIIRVAIFSCLLASSHARAAGGQAAALFNGRDLTGWHVDVPADDSNVRRRSPFVVRNGVLVSLGEPRGHLITDSSYRDYRLELEYRFPAAPGNAGVLVHASTPRALYGMFPRSIEVQMEHGNAGDFWCILEDIRVPDMESRRGPPAQWGTTEGKARRIRKLTDDSEQPVGEWNTMVIEAVGRSIKVWVNGDLVNDGSDATADHGRIALQSEGSEVEFRKLSLTPISKLAIVGRWDLTVLASSQRQPSWLEVQKSGDRTLVGRFVGVVGSARPISKVEFSDKLLRFSIPPQWEKGNNDLHVEGALDGDQLSGWLTDPAGNRYTWTGKRAPPLRRASPPTWGAPIVLFDGTDMASWQAFGESQWRVAGGVLTNTRAGANLVTRHTFTDFKLHLEFRYPTGGNSGVYLRGRYEVQIEDSHGLEPASDHLGAIYGFLPPNEDVARKPGEWQTFDITLVGRLVTVVLNGKAVIGNQEIPGITGGALDSDETAPGPLLLQGDHGPVEFRNIVLTPAQ